MPLVFFTLLLVVEAGYDVIMPTALCWAAAGIARRVYLAVRPDPESVRKSREAGIRLEEITHSRRTARAAALRPR
jgi:hypothetical protein